MRIPLYLVPFPARAARRTAAEFPSVRRLLTVGTCLRATVLKIPPHPCHVALHSVLGILLGKEA
jgi:hypothetical protein